ncbi:hypothetical protein GCM10028807_57140 [Spirosoma daeguense]
MDELDKNIPDDLWRKVFDEASETPPLRVWDAIERQLDESNGPKILPLWGMGLASSRPVAWGIRVAAAVAMLLVGWWAITTLSVDKSEKTISAVHQSKEADVASAQESDSKDVAEKKSSTNLLAPETRLSQEPEHLTSPDVSASGTIASRAKSQRSERNVTTSEQHESVSNRFRTRGARRYQNTDDLASFDKRANTVASVSRPSATFSKALAGEVMYAPVSAVEARSIDEQAYATASISQLRNKSLRLGGVRPIQRIVWFRPAELPLESAIENRKHERREMWASVGMMSGTFNPMVSVQSAPAMAMVSSAPSKNNPSSAFKNTQPSINSRSSLSVAYQAGAGVQLSEHWTLESGIGFLSGRSIVETPTQSNAYSNLAVSNSNLFVDALRTSTSNRAMMDQQMVSNTSNNFSGQTVYNELSQQTLTNNYQFMQVPVQVGYQIRPRKRLSMSVLGGLLTNIFVKNTVGDNVVVTAQDGVYRPVSLAATMGARFRYRPSRQWSASVAGVYQPSLTSGTQAESQVQSHPTTMGMSFGVDYHF